MRRQRELRVLVDASRGINGVSKMFQRTPRYFYVPFGLQVSARLFASFPPEEVRGLNKT